MVQTTVWFYLTELQSVFWIVIVFDILFKSNETQNKLFQITFLS